MTAWLDALDDAARDLVAPGPPPTGKAAMKAMLTDERFSDPAWIFERKLDGIRCVAVRDGGAGAALLAQRPLARRPLPRARRGARRASRASASRSTARSSPSSAAGRASPGSRSAAQRRVAVFLYVFDILWLDGCDVRPLPLLARKRLLRCELTFEDGVRLTPYRREDGEALFAEACRKGWEGLIAKRADSAYSDRRSRDWLKMKCEQGQELVIGGFTAPRGSRTELGALLLGFYDGGGCATRARSAPASTRRRCATSARGCAPCAATTRRSPTPARSRSAASRGSSPSSSRRSASPSGPAPAACATRASSACATTRRRPRSCASAEPADTVRFRPRGPGIERFRTRKGGFMARTGCSCGRHADHGVHRARRAPARRRRARLSDEFRPPGRSCRANPREGGTPMSFERIWEAQDAHVDVGPDRRLRRRRAHRRAAPRSAPAGAWRSSRTARRCARTRSSASRR